jgi:hypothetical protein
MTGWPWSASTAAWWLNGMLASRGISDQMLSSLGAAGNSGVVAPQSGQTWPLMFSTPATCSAAFPDTWLPDTWLPDTRLPDTRLPGTGLPDIRRGRKCPISRRASWCAIACGVATTSTAIRRPVSANTNCWMSAVPGGRSITR